MEVSRVEPTVSKSTPAPTGFEKYTIAQGQQYCDKNGYNAIQLSELKFTVKFDSSAIYQTIDPVNQLDINKLYGFSDNNALHHDFSARFGWRWSNNALRLFAYVYNNGVQANKELGTVAIGTENSCSIKVAGDKYIFTLNGKTDTMPRASTTANAVGYKLYPYFGGDEFAPHTISIWIKEAGAL
jgi:hypothetical protein